MTELIRLERDGPVARLLLNRPEKLNAFTLAMWRRFGEQMTEVVADESLRCLLLSGGESAAFGAGADIAEFLEHRSNAVEAEAYSETMEPGLSALADCPFPTVAAIRGACMGGGLELALLCDIRIAAADARFGIPINRIGHCLPFAGLRPLVALVGQATAAEILLEGRVFDAEEALAKGLVTRVVATDALEEEAAGTVRRIAKGAPLAARLHKRFIRRAADPRPLSSEEERAPFQVCDSDDYREGIRAFLAKEKPSFAGR